MTVNLINPDDLKRSLPKDEAEAFDADFGRWVIDIVSAAALHETRQAWKTPDDVPSGVVPVLALACRRLYTNPDRFTRESDGSYSYGLDESVTKAGIFTADQLAILHDYRAGVAKITGLGTVSTYRGDLYERPYMNEVFW